MNPNVPVRPSMMLPPQLLRGGQNSAATFMPQNPLATGMSPSAMGANPSLMQQPAPGSDAGNPTMPGPTPPPLAGMQDANAQPGSGQPQLSEAQYILNALADRLKHHSKITEKTVSTLSDMISAQAPTPDEGGGNPPTA